MSEPRYRRVILKMSGEALLGDQGYGIDPNMVARLAEDVADSRKLGVQVGIVVGGGNIFRGMTVAKAGGRRITGDHLGMLATVMNAISVRDALLAKNVSATVLSALAVPAVCDTFSQRAAETAFERGEVIVFAGGTGNPIFTTDSGAALRAAELGCDALLKGTKVDGIYSADPVKDPNAERFDSLTHEDVLKRGLNVMDTAAVAIARESGIPIVVFSILQPGAFADILRGKGRATVVAEA